MRRLLGLTRRNLLIATHDALATALAVVLSFFLRFGEIDFSVRLPMLLVILPYFVLLSVVVCYFFDLTTTKWRFTSLPEILNIAKVSTILSVALLVLDYVFVAPNFYGSFYFGKTTIVIYWMLQIALLSGTQACLPLLSNGAHANKGAVCKRDACPSAGQCGGSGASHSQRRERRGSTDLAAGAAVSVGGRQGPDDQRHPGPGRARGSEGGGRSAFATYEGGGARGHAAVCAA